MLIILLAVAQQVWTDPADPTLPPDFKIQGEYAGEKLGAQVIALAGGAFQAVLYPGGLPGAGWDGKSRIMMDGKLEGDKAQFKAPTGKKEYLNKDPAMFSAVSKFPPEGQRPCTATIAGGVLQGTIEGGERFELKRLEHKSPTLGAAPPKGAIVLFDGSGTDEWTGGRLDAATKFLNTDGKDVVSKRKFSSYSMHVEFMLPYRPEGRGQGRGNSGLYMISLYEVQVLDSFGLEGKNNECGGIYNFAAPRLNMCLPPLVWQTYDVELQNAVVDASGAKTKPAVTTVRHNGELIHEKLELKGPTGGARNEPEGTPGPIKLQGHGNPLQYRNIWIVPREP